MKKRYQIGFRILPLSHSRWDTPYIDLPEFEATYEEMDKVLDELQCSFYRTAEWRCVEVVK